MLPPITDITDELDRRSFLRFKERVWWMPQELKIGLHTKALGDRLTQAVKDFKAGKSTFLIVRMPFRHGKSDDISRAFPAYCLGALREYEPDIIMASYAADLSEGFSRKVKQIINSDSYQSLFPDVKIDPNRAAIGKWAIDNSAGEVSAVGLRGAITGKGGHVILIDDFFKSREEAEGQLHRDKVWQGITQDIMTRRTDVCICIICATPWHVDDPIGRIHREMKADPKFPRFDDIGFPAESDSYDSGYLFPERFSSDWYDGQRATLGPYAAAGLLDVNPTMRMGNIFKAERVQFHDDIDEFPDLIYRRGWDLASTVKQRTSSDPDYTAGSLCSVNYDSEGAMHIWIKDCVYCREEAPARDRLIIATHHKDGRNVPISMESVAGYKDAYTTLKAKLRGLVTIKKVGAIREKMAKMSFMEAPFEAGHVHMLRAPWNTWLVNQFSVFPNGHDDGPDSVYVAIEEHSRRKIIPISRNALGL